MGVEWFGVDNPRILYSWWREEKKKEEKKLEFEGNGECRSYNGITSISMPSLRIDTLLFSEHKLTSGCT